ncbi:unnamed protein product [Amaranthus hypochondriacus]
MGRAPCCEKMGLKKGPWTPEEDQILINYIRLNGHNNWRALPKLAGLLRCGKSCRLRWTNYLRPDIKRGNFTQDEEETIIKLHEMLGNRWSAIAARLPGRTDNEIKNVWHTHLKKRLVKQTEPDQIVSTTTTRTTKKRSRKPKSKEKNMVSKVIKCEPVSPQPCTSTSSIITSSSSGNNANFNKENVVLSNGYIGDFPELNDEFWMEVLSVEDTAMSTDDNLPSVSHCNFDTSENLIVKSESESGSKFHCDEMDFFWYNLLTRNDDLPEFSEMM